MRRSARGGTRPMRATELVDAGEFAYVPVEVSDDR
jgi:hypothetical protein